MKREDILILLIFLLFVQGYLFRNVFPAIFAFSLISYLIYLRSEFNPEVLAERRVNGKSFLEGEEIISVLKLKNLSNGNLKIRIVEETPPRFKVKLPEVFVLEDEKEIRYSIIPVKGIYKLRGPKIYLIDERELYYKNIEVNSSLEIEVYPSVDSIKADAEIELSSSSAKSLLGLQTLEFHSLREFQPGDDIKFIDWKATARIGELVVKEFLKEGETDVYIILDAGKEMRKGVKNSKIDYASILTLQLVKALERYRVGLIIYDDFGVKCKIEASKAPNQIKKFAKALKIKPEYSNLIGLKIGEISFKVSEESKKFVKKVFPIIKRRRSLSSGIIESISAIRSPSLLIFISDISSHTSELLKVLIELKKKHKILLLTPNPILFYDESKLDRDTLIWLYKRYIEREEIIKRINRIVPTLDVGPSDLIEIIGGAIK